MLGEQVARQQKALQAGASDTIDATCVGVDLAGGFASVNVGGVVQVMPWQGAAPWAGDRVRVSTLGRKPICAVQYGAAQGTVASVTSTTATVTGDDTYKYTYPFAAGSTLVSGDRVALDHAHRLVVGKYAAEPAGSEFVTPAAPPAPAKQSRWFYPTDSGNYRFGSYVSQFAEVSENRAAYYWYGTQIASTIPDTATITRCELRLVEVWDELPTVASRIATHADASSVHTASAPALTGSIEITGGGTYNISAYATALKNGTAYGVGFPAGFGWRRFDTAARSGAIFIEWSP